ncbi:MAG TPA: helix-turn-helix domain-containing protein [Pyrinomonadaceae bacterium]|nr:helix-turn-helix domain-containing protein [Pyrinomonadaceae bacterium]
MKDFNDIKTRRIALNLTQAELGKIFEVDGNTIARWERGDSKPPLGLIDLAFEALEIRRSLEDPKLQEMKQTVSANIENQLTAARQRVKHARK